jgi:hypothetical protein
MDLDILNGGDELEVQSNLGGGCNLACGSCKTRCQTSFPFNKCKRQICKSGCGDPNFVVDPECLTSGGGQDTTNTDTSGGGEDDIVIDWTDDTTTTQQKQDGGMSTGAKIAIGVGAALVVGLTVVLVVKAAKK